MYFNQIFIFFFLLIFINISIQKMCKCNTKDAETKKLFRHRYKRGSNLCRCGMKDESSGEGSGYEDPHYGGSDYASQKYSEDSEGHSSSNISHRSGKGKEVVEEEEGLGEWTGSEIDSEEVLEDIEESLKKTGKSKAKSVLYITDNFYQSHIQLNVNFIYIFDFWIELNPKFMCFVIRGFILKNLLIYKRKSSQ
ncbi:unnamed protein product [Meloidogyne enterolobii]|uniref:Uncharacterized protein n=1 Tax=Meloidogyne enterolobii TaxID=390850 RepID=A0ACB1AC40_MELEN